nr:hypothetical protein [Tanacetum cinerariifolium]
MSRDVNTVGSKMRILLLYRGEYSQWRERFMNYLEEQTNAEAMINSIQNGDQPLPVIAQVNKTAKDLWDALERQMRGSESVVTRKTTQNQGDVNDALGYKKKAVVVTSDPLALVTEKTKVKDYNYYKTNMLLAKKHSDEQVLLTEDQAWMESSSDSDQEINANMVFMAQIEKVLLESDESSSSAKETIAEV